MTTEASGEEKTWQELLEETDRHIKECVKCCVALKNIVDQAREFREKSLEQQWEARRQADIVKAYTGAALELSRQAFELRKFSEKFGRKAGLFEKGALD